MAEIKLVNQDYTKPSTGIRLVNTDYTKPVQDTPLKPTGETVDGIPTVTTGEVEKSPFQKFSEEVNSPAKKVDPSTHFNLDVFGYKITLPRTDKPVSTTEQQEIPDVSPYKGLIEANKKELNLPDFTILKDPVAYVNNTKALFDKTLQDVNALNDSTPEEITDFVQQKKQLLKEKAEQEKQFIDASGKYQIEGVGKTSNAANVASQRALDFYNIDSEYNALSTELDNIAKQAAFVKSPIMSNDRETYINKSNSDLILIAQQVGNDIQNVTDPTNRATFQAKSFLNSEEGGYTQNYKDKLAYVGLQAEIYNTQSLLQKDQELANQKLNEIAELQNELNTNPTDKTLISQMQQKVAEFNAIKSEVDNKKQFITKLSQATLELPEYTKAISLQNKIDKNFELYSQSLETDQPDLAQAGIYAIQGLSNRILKSAAYGDVALQAALPEALGSTKEQQTVDLADLSELKEFIPTPTKLKEGKVIKYSKDGSIEGINWNVALPMTLQTTGETLVMGAVGSPLAGLGKLGQLGGLYVGSTAVFGGDILQSELEKGLPFGEAVAVTGLRLGVEAATEMIALPEFIPFNGITKSVSRATKADFINFVGNNWQKLIPKWKAKGLDITKILFQGAKGVGYETIEEVLSDLGNYGLDGAIIAGIKPDYRRDNEFTLESEINTALTTALTMLPMGAYGGYQENKANKQAPILRWSASQMPKLFQDNLQENLKKGNITQEFYETGKKEIETISNLYNINKTQIEAVDEEEKPYFLDALYNHDKASKELLNNTDPSKIDELTKAVENTAKQVQSFNQDALKEISLTPKQKLEKKEKIYIENLKEFTTSQEIKQSSLQDLNTAISVLSEVVQNPFSPKVAEQAQKHIDSINEEIELRKNSIEKIEPEGTELSERDYAFQVLNLPKEEIDNLETEGNLTELVSSDKNQKQKVANFTNEFNEAKVLPIYERNDALSSLALKAAEEGLFDLASEIDQFKEQGDVVKIGDDSYTIGQQVTYQGSDYTVERDPNNPEEAILSSGNSTVKPKSPKDISIIEPQDKLPVTGDVNLVPQQSVEGLFGKPNVIEETPVDAQVSDTEAKKADVERKRQKDLSKLDYEYSKGEHKGTFSLRSNEINAKYDAELEALEQTEEKSTETIEQQIEEVAPTETNPQSEELIPETDTEEAKDEAVDNKRQLDNPVNPFRNTYFKRGTVFANVLTNLYNLSKTKKLSDEGYFVSVIKSQDIPWEQLPKEARDYFKSDDSDKRKEDNGKYLVITNKEGIPYQFNPEGEKTEVGAIALDVFPTTKSETELSNAKFDISNSELTRVGKTREWFLNQIRKIHEARNSKSNIVYTIDNIHQGGFEINVEKPLSLKETVQGKEAKVFLKGGKAFVSVDSTEIPVNRPLFPQSLIDTVLFIVQNKGASITDTKEKQEFVKKIVGENFFRTVAGTKLAFSFKFDKGLLIPQVTYPGQTAKPINTEELAEILSKITPNIDKLSLEANQAFNFYTFNGKKLNKSTYPTYSDFVIDNFNSYTTDLETQTTPEYFLEPGEIVGSIADKIEEASDETVTSAPVEEEKTITPTDTNPTEEPAKKKIKKKYDIDDSFDFGSILKRAKTLLNRVTKEQETQAKQWFDSSPISKHIKLKQLQNILNSDAFATWSSSAITLYKDSKFTDLYHESWHEFSQLYLTKAQKDALYNEVRNTVPSLKNASPFDVEEHIAEDFLKYILSNQTLILNGKPKRNSIFRTVFNFLKEWVTGTTDIQTYYERLYTGNISNYKRDLNNAYFGTLNKGIEGIIDGQVRNLTNAETKSLYKAIDSVFVKIFESSGKPITLMFEDNNVVPTVYKGLLNYFKAMQNKTIDKFDSLDPSSPEAAQEQQIYDNLEFIIQNFYDRTIETDGKKTLIKGIVSNHSRYSSYFNITKDTLKFDESGNLVDSEDFAEDLDENNLRDSSIVKNENVSSREAASNETLYLIATLPKYSLGERENNSFLPFIQDTVDFNNTWNILTKALNNTLEYSEVINKIQALSTKYPWAENLIQRLPDPNKTLLTDAEQRLKAAFLNDLSKPKVDTYEVVVNQEGNSVSFTYSQAAATDRGKLRQKWQDSFSQLTPLDNDFIEENEEGVTFLNTPALYEAFKSVFPTTKTNYTALDKQTVFNSRLEFLSSFGIEFSEETLSSTEFFDFITAFKSPIVDLFRLTGKLAVDVPQSYNPIQDLNKLKYSKEDKNLEFFSKIFPKILDEELKYSETLFTQSVKNAEQNSVWQIRQWSYISKVYNALNDVNKYPTYQSLINEPWLKQFDIASNPYVNGLFLNTIFDLKTGNRRQDNNGNYVTITLQDYNGLRINTKDGKTNEGKTTTGLTDYEKVVQNFNTLLQFGVQEHLRYGDKSSSFGTLISHVLNPETGKLENRSLSVPISKFIDEEENLISLPNEALLTLMAYIKTEMLPMKANLEQGIGNNWRNYNKNIKDFGIFEGILSTDTKGKLRKDFIENSDVTSDKASSVVKSLQSDIEKDLKSYIKDQYRKLDKQLKSNELSDKNIISAPLLKNANSNQLKLAYVVNSLIYNIEHTKLITGDPRFYSAKSGKKDPFKRFSQFTATGNVFVVDEQTNNYIANKTRAIKEVVAKKLGITIPTHQSNGIVNSVIFNDAKYDSKVLVATYTEYFKSKGYSQEQIDELLEKYKDITEADGQGYVTLDEYRESKLRAGSSHWTKQHEVAYQKEADFLLGKSTTGASEEELALFMPQKWQYSGTTIDGNYTIPVFHKYSVVPLIPSAIKGTSFEEIHDNLIRQNIGLALFESGSKHSSITNEDGKFNNFYENSEERTPFTGDYTINPIFYQYLKEQVNVEPKLKGKVTFSTQMRKLLHLNLFKDGVPIVPNFKEIEQRFANIVENLINLEKEAVLSQMGATLSGDKYTFDASKLQKFFQAEFEKRGLPDEVIDYLQVGENNKFTYPLDASSRRDKIEKIAYAIANKRLVQQKINGEALIQVAATGFELNTDKLKEVKEDAGLPFYRVVDGKTKAMKVKVAFSDKWKPLLNLKHPDGSTISSLDRLNEAIKDEKWLESNYKNITIVGVRIPVQGLNSQEFMEVHHFLPESSGAVIIVSPYLVAKSGGDFDIDKLTTFFPNLDINGNVYTPKSEETLKKEYDILLKEYRDAVKEGKDEATDRLIGRIFNVDPLKLEKERKKELIEEIFGTESLPTFEKYKLVNQKKGFENELISIMRETLELEHNFEQLISPNDTDLLEPFAQELKNLQENKPKGTWTELVEFAEIARQFQSNLVGKSNLGIAAVWNTFFALSQRAGLTLNSDYIHVNSGGKKIPTKTRINMPHNQTDGKISLSGLMDVENIHKISKIFEQAINGFVDVAKDDWIFYINGVKELVPTMLFTAAAGVNNKNLVAFYNQPVLREYVKEIQKYKNLFVKIQTPDNYTYATRKALEDIVISRGDELKDPTLKKLFEIFKKAYNNSQDVSLEEGEETSSLKQKEILASIEKNKSFTALLKALQDKAATNKELFTTPYLNKSVFEKTPLTAEEDLLILAHFEELKQLASKVTTLQRSLNADTKKATDSFSIYDRRQRLKEAYDTNLFPKEEMEKLFNESTVRAFTNTKTGFDNFAGQLFTELFEITNHPEFNKKLRELIQADKQLLFRFKSSEQESLIKTLKNDFISYLYQNNVFQDNLQLVSKAILPLFRPKTSLSRELQDLKRKYEDKGLLEQFPLLQQLVTDKSKNIVKPVSNIRLKTKLSDRDELNSAVYQIRQLLQFNNPNYTLQEQLEIQAFAKKFTEFAIIQSGLNSSIFNIMDLVPNEEYTKGIAPFILGFKTQLDSSLKDAQAEISRFYRKFKIQNPSFYERQTDEETGALLGNFESNRLKDYTSTQASDVTGLKTQGKQIETAEYIKTIPSKVSFGSPLNSATIKKNPNSLILVENNKLLTATKGLTEPNFSSIITKEAIGKPLIDANLTQNKQLIDNFIAEIVEKSKNFTNITLNSNGYGQHLKTDAPQTFDYLSQRLLETFNFQNPNYTPTIQEDNTTEENKLGCEDAPF